MLDIKRNKCVITRPKNKNLEEWFETNKIPEFFWSILAREAHVHTLDELKECVCDLGWTTAEDWKELKHDDSAKLIEDQKLSDAFIKFINAIQSLKSDSMILGSGNPFIVNIS